jgi:hypothetical protein
MKYLGINYHWTWNLDKIARNTRVNKIARAKKHYNLIASPYHTCFTKMVLLKSYIIPKLNFGSEFLGNHDIDLISNMLNSFLKKACSSYATPCILVLWRDMDIVPLKIRNKASMLRIWLKGSMKSTHGIFSEMVDAVDVSNCTYMDELRKNANEIRKTRDKEFSNNPKKEAKLYQTEAFFFFFCK